MIRTIAAVSVVAALSSVSFAQFFESGAAGTFSNTNWVTDRYEPNAWQPGATDPIGGTALRVGLSNADRHENRPAAFQSSFYNTQGRQRTGAPILGQGWEVGGSLFIPASWGQAGNLRSSSLWSRDASVTEAAARYTIVGFINNDPSDAFNPNAANFQPRFRVWDPSVGYVDLAATVNYGAYNTFRIVDTGTSFDYYINGVSVASFGGGSYSDVGSEGLNSVFVQAYNFGTPANSQTLQDSGYDAYWQNVYAVPTPGAAALAGLGALAGLRRRRA